MAQDIAKLMDRYAQEQTAGRFLELQQAIADSSDYAPYTQLLGREAHDLLNGGHYEKAIEHLMSMMPNWLLNPGIHRMLSFAHDKVGSEGKAEFERNFAGLAMQGLLSTGDGSREKPYRVLHTRDEYDLLAYLGKEPSRQSLVPQGRWRFDRIECKDGTEVWFDITFPFSHLSKHMGR